MILIIFACTMVLLHIFYRQMFIQIHCSHFSWVVFLQLIIRGFYILYVKAPYQIYDLKISPLCVLAYHFLDGTFEVTKKF